MKRLLTLLFAAVLVAQLPGCAAPEGGASSASPTMSGEGEPFTFTDDLGRAVTVDDPQRVAVLMGSFAEVWLLAGGTLAAVTEDAFSERDLDLDDSVALVGSRSGPCDPLCQFRRSGGHGGQPGGRRTESGLLWREPL